MAAPVRILGGSQTDFATNWKKQGKNFVDMLREVTFSALEQTALDDAELARLNQAGRIGIFVGNFGAELYCKQGHLGGFPAEIDPRFSGIPAARYEAACASGAVAIQAAHTAIRAGDYDVALVIGIEVMKTVSPVEGGDFLGTAAWYEKEAQGVDFAFPRLFGRLKDELQERYALDPIRFRNNLSEISRTNFANARKNPLAQTRDWPNADEDAKARAKMDQEIGSLTIYDCSQVTDGAALTVLASNTYAQAYAKRRGIKLNALPAITGWGHRNAPVSFETKMTEARQSGTILPWTQRAAAEAYAKAGLSAEQIDVFETHDCFTSSEYAAIGLLGITPPGEEFKAIESGRITLEGNKPINPSGGLIGAGHPVGATGVRMLLDLYRQLTATAGAYQVTGAKSGAMLNIGGSATTSMVYVVQNV